MMLEATTGFQVIQELPVCKHSGTVLPQDTTDETCNAEILHEQPSLKKKLLKFAICIMHLFPWSGSEIASIQLIIMLLETYKQ